MRKLIAKACLLLLLSMVLIQPALAQSKRSQLEDFVCSHYGLQPQEVVWAEFYEVHLEHIDLHFSLLHWFTQGPEYRKGMVAWVEETDEYLADGQVAALMEEERLKMTEEYRRLQAEAGKMEIDLYKELLQGNPEAEYEIYILPLYQFSQELQEQIEELYREYGLEPRQDFLSRPDGIDGSGSCEPAVPPQEPGSAGSGSGIDSCQPATAPTPPLPAPAPDTIDPVDPVDDRVAPPDEPVSSDGQPREIYLPYPADEFYAALEHLRQQGYAQALSSLTEYLDSIGAAYTVEGYLITATLPAAEIQNLARREDVQWVGSLYRWDAEIDLPLAPAPAFDDAEIATDSTAGRQGEAPSEGEFLAADSTAPARDNTWFWAGGTLVVFLILGAILFKK